MRLSQRQVEVGLSNFTEVSVRKIIASLGLLLAGMISFIAMSANAYGYDSASDYYGSGFYVGANAGEMFYKEQGLGVMVPSVAFVQIGEQFNPYLAVEGRLGGGITGDNFMFYHVDVPVVYGGYVKGILPMTPWFSGYAIAGAGGVQLHRNYPDFNSSNVGLSLGLGGEFTLYGGARLHAEWARIDSGNNVGYDYTVDQLSVGVSWHL
jgi:Outer membrane protein beta-barrel domain